MFVKMIFKILLLVHFCQAGFYYTNTKDYGPRQSSPTKRYVLGKSRNIPMKQQRENFFNIPIPIVNLTNITTPFVTTTPKKSTMADDQDDGRNGTTKGTQTDQSAANQPLDINKLFNWIIKSSPFLINNSTGPSDDELKGPKAPDDNRDVIDWISQRFSSWGGIILIAGIFINIICISFCYIHGCSDAFNQLMEGK